MAERNLFGLNPLDRAIADFESKPVNVGLGLPQLARPGQSQEDAEPVRIPAAQQPDYEPMPQQAPQKALKGLAPPPNYLPVFENAARKYNVPVNVLMALGHQESRYNPNARGPMTQWGQAHGLMQYLNSTAKNLGINPYDPNQAIEAAAMQIRERLDKGYSMEDAVKEHFAGPNRKLWGAKTRRYGIEVLEKARALAGELYPDEGNIEAFNDLIKREANPNVTQGNMSIMADGPMSVPAGTNTKDIADIAKLPDLSEPEQDSGNLFDDAGRQLLGGVYKGIGSTIRGLGTLPQMLGEYTTTPLINKIFGTNYRTGNLLDTPADLAKNYGEALQAGVSEVTKEAIKESTPDGDLFDPSTWTFGKDPSVRGYTALGLDVLGQMFPVLASTVATGGGSAAVRYGTTAVVGGAQGGGGAVEQANEVIDTLAKQKGEDGRSLLEAQSSYYRELRNNGMDEAEAIQRTKDAAAHVAFVLTAPISAAGGMATAKIINPAEKILSGTNIAGRIAGRAALGGAEEGAQEVTESVQTKQGINLGAGTDMSVTEGTFADFVLGALGGSVPGAAGGALSKREEKQPAQPAPAQAEPQAAPQPEQAAPEAPVQTSSAPGIDLEWQEPQGRVDTRGPLTKAIERGEQAAAERRVAVETPAGIITGFMDSYQEDGQGGWVARVLGDDGQLHQFTSADPVRIVPEAQAVAEQQAGAIDPDTGEIIQQGGEDADLQREQPTGGDATADDGRAPSPEAVAPVEADQPQRRQADTTPPVEQQEDTGTALAELRQGVADDANAGQQAPSLKVEDMTPEQLQERRDYLIAQARNNGGWNKKLIQERNRIDAALNQLSPPASEQAKPAEQVTPRNTVVKTEGGVPLVELYYPREGAYVLVRRDHWEEGRERLAAFNSEGKRNPGVLNSVPRDLLRTPQREADVAERADAVIDSQAFVEPDVIPESAYVEGEAAQQTQPAPASEQPEPKLKNGMVRVYHSGVAGEGETGRWVSTNREYASNYRADLPLFYIDLPANDSRLNNPDYPEQGVSNGFTFNFELTPKEAVGLRQISRGQVDTKPKKASKEDLERLFGIDQKRAKALERIAKGRAWFGDQQKARDFITKNGLKDTHEAVQTGAKRWEAQAKSTLATSESQAVNDFIEGKRDDAPTVEEVRAEQQRTQSNVVVVDDDVLSIAREETKAMGGLIWSDVMNDQQGVIPGKPTNINRSLKKGSYTLDDLAALWQKTRDYLRSKYGDTVTLYRADAPQSERNADTQVVYMGDESLARKFERDDRSVQAFEVPVDDVLGLNAQPNGYYEFIVKRQGNTAESVSDTSPQAVRAKRKSDKAFKEAFDSPQGANGPDVESGPAGEFLRGWLDAEAGKEVDPSQVSKPTAEMRQNGFNPVDSYRSGYESQKAGKPVRIRTLDDASPTSAQSGEQKAPKATKKKPTVKQRTQAEKARIEDFYTPGNIITGYSGEPDRVLSFDWNDGDIKVTVERVRKDGDQWVAIEGKRTHSTRPDRLSKVVERAQPADQMAVNQETRADAEPAAADQTAVNETPSTSPDADRFAGNKIFTADKVEAARARLRAKLGQINSGIDPETLIDGMTIAGAYIESGVRNFSDYAQRMVADLGDGVKPYLLSFWEGARNYPGLDTKDMTGVDKSKRQFDAFITPADAKTEAVGDIVTKPAKRTKKTGQARDRVLTQDWGVDHIDAYSEEGEQVKANFLKEARSYLNAVAEILTENGFTPHMDKKGRPEKPVSVNESGIAGSGDISLTLAGPNGTGAYVHIGDSALRGVVPTTQSGIAIMFRASENSDKYGAKGSNQWAPVDLSAADFAALIEAHVKRVDGSAASQAQARIEQGEQNARNAIYEDGARPLEEVEAEDVQGIEGQGDAERGSAEGQQGSGQAGSATDAVRVPAARGRGSRASRNDTASPGRKRVSPAKEQVEQQLPDLFETAPEAEIAQASAPNVPAANFVIDDSLELGRGTEGQKYQDNVAAIKTLKQIEQEGRRATPDEQRILARYVGWGGLKNAFRVAGAKEGQGVAKGWEARVSELEELLTPAELRAARNSTTAAHYTSQTVVEAIWKGVERLGFNGGSVLEPSVGTGNFIGLMPESVRGSSNVLAVEYDSLTARIAQQLYPQSTILHSGFESVPTPRNYFALAIGNPPFGRESLTFKGNPSVNGKSIHNQFFLASLDAVTEDGLMGMVVSHNLMDALGNSARLDMAAKAHFLGAIRLPDTAFKENARTEVVTDILFFRKRNAKDADLAQRAVNMIKGIKDSGDRLNPDDLNMLGSIRSNIESWVNSQTIQMPDKTGADASVNVNEYFLANPRMVLGRMDASGTMNARADLNVRLDDPSTFESLLNAAIERLPRSEPKDGVAERSLMHYETVADALRLAVNRAEPGAITKDADGKLKMVVDMDGGDLGKSVMREIELTADTPFNEEYNLTLDGKWQRTVDLLGEDGKPLKVMKNGKATNRNEKQVLTFDNLADIPAKDKWGADRVAIVTDMLPIRNLMKRQLMLESTDANERMIEENRARLNKAYDGFVEKHGQLHSQKVAKIALMMPDGALALAAETVTGKGASAKYGKADIMSRRVTMPPKPAEKAATPADAVAISLSEYGGINVERIATLLGTDEAGAIEAISKPDAALAYFDPEAQDWVSTDQYLSGPVRRKLLAAKSAGLESNIAALEKVIPEDWDSSQITPNIGSAWIPGDVYADFIKHLGYKRANVSYSAVTNAFDVRFEGEPTAQWQTSGRAHNPAEIVSRLLNSRSMKVTYTDNEGKTHVDEEATAETQIKANEIFNEFLDWVYVDDDRRNELVRIFNEKYNTRVVRQYEGSHLQLPGKVPDQIIKMRRHQKNAIWRGIIEDAVLYDHVVGAGKTYTAIARIMERRRMGMSRKPMVVVPNHLIEQWASDVTKLYPGAKVLAAGKADFERKNRRKLFARIASGDYDMVIIGHSSFGFIEIDPATEQRYIEEELRAAYDAIEAAQQAAEEAGFTGFRKPLGVAEAERLVKKLESRLDKLRSGNRDRLLTFEEMGVDDLTVDEAHEFKNLAYNSNLTGVSGMGNKTGSQKAMDLHIKVRSLRERQGTSVAFLTGTPISNSVAEMFLVLKNLVPNELKELGIDNFDAWRSMFVSYAAAYEPTEAGGVKEVTRLGREWMNMKSLMDLYYSVSDAVTLDDIKTAFAEDNPGKEFPVPKVKSQKEGKGDRAMVAVKPSAEQREILREIVSGFESLRGISDLKERNAMRLRLMDRARKVSLDPRAVDPTITVSSKDGKIPAVVNNVARIYKKWDADKGTQVIFLDRSVPKAKGDDKKLAEYDALRDKLRIAMEQEDEAGEAAAVDALAKYNANEMEEIRNALAGGWNAYEEIKRQLVEQGIPENEVRFVQEANTDEQKKALFNLVKSGAVRVLIGSTPRMGAGTNVQDRLVALHHVDVTWKPSDIEQREGRIVRQGNQLLEKYGGDFEVEVIAYATEMTVDAKMWALNATKLKAINGIRKYDGSFMMEFEDEESANMAEMAALATGNPLMVERVTLTGDIQKLELQQRSYKNRVNALRDSLNKARRMAERGPKEAELFNAFADAIEQQAKGIAERTEQRSLTVGGKTFNNADDASLAAAGAIEKARKGDEKARFSVEAGGNNLTSQSAIADAISEAFGDPGFEATIDGKTFIGLSDASKTLTEKVGRAIVSSGGRDIMIDGVTINGMKVEIDVSEQRFSKGADKDITFILVNNTGESMGHYRSVLSGGVPTQGGMRAGLQKLFGKLNPQEYRNGAKRLVSDAKEAEKKIPGLEEQVAKPWDKAQELEDKRNRLKDVISQLESASDSARLADDAESQDDGTRFSVAPQTDTAAFKRWFGDSKVVDADGNPLVVYHGTNADFTEFDREQSREGDGIIFVTPNQRVASDFATYRSTWAGANVMPVYVKAEKILEVMGNGRNIRDVEVDTKIDGMKYGEDVRDFAARNGYDAIVFREVRDPISPDIDPIADVYALLPTAEIKSATGNIGTFDPANPDIRLSAATDTGTSEGRASQERNAMMRHADVMNALREGPLGSVIDKLIGDGHIIIHPTKKSLPRSIKAKGGAIQGYTDTDGRIHLAAEGLTRQTAMPVALHEGFHGHGEKLVGTRQWNAMMRRMADYQKAARKRKAEGRVKEGDFYDQALRRVDAAIAQGAIAKGREAEEFAAYAIESYELAPAGIKKWVDDFIGMVKDWLARRFNIQVGEVTPAQLRAFAVAALRSAEGTMPQVNASLGGSSIGRGALSTQSIGTDSPAFKRWFGQSKIVDAKGNPLKVYHGTNAQFTEFSRGMVGSNTGMDNTGLGFFFIADRQLADDFAQETSGGDRIIEAYLSIQKPMMLTSKDVFSNAEQAPTLYEIFSGERLSPDEALEAINDEIGLGEFGDIAEAMNSQEARDILERDGYDGVVAEFGRGVLEYVAFRPEQIKSATDNVGTFDPNNADIRFSVPDQSDNFTAEEREAALKEANDSLDDDYVPPVKTDHIGRAIRDMDGASGLYQRFMAHPYTIASLHKEFTPVMMTAVSQNQMRNRIIEDLHREYRAYEGLSSQGKANVNKALELGRLTANVYTDEQLKDGVKNPGYRYTVRYDEDGTPRRVRQDIEAGLTKAGDTFTLTDDEIKAYRQLRAMFDRALNMFRDQVLEEYGLERFVGLDNAAKAMMEDAAKLPKFDTGRAELENMAQFIGDIEQAKRTGYVPFTRYGDYVIAVKERQADIQYTKGEDGYFLARNVPDAMDEYLDRIGATYDASADAWVITEEQRKQLEDQNEVTIYSEKVETNYRDMWGRSAERKVKNERRPVSDIPSVKKAIDRVMAERIGDNPNRRIVAFSTSKKRNEGGIDMSSLDALAEVAMLDKATWDSVREQFAKALQSGGFRKHFFQSSNVPGYSTDFERSTADYMVGLAGYLSRRAHSKQFDKVIADIKGEKLHQYAVKYRDYINEPSEEFALLRQTGFLFYIAGNISSAGLNSTQVAIMTMPFLNQFTSNPQATAEMTRAYKDAVGMLTVKEGMDIFDFRKAPADIRAELMRAKDEGLLLPLQSLEIMGAANRRTVEGRKYQKGYDTLTQGLALPFTAMERLNRVVTFIAASRLSKKSGTRKQIEQVFRNNPMARAMMYDENGDFNPYGFGEFAVNETQFVMGKLNRPTMMRSVGSPIFQFKSFILQFLETVFIRWPALQGKRGKRARNLALFMMVLLAGMWGFPGADDLRELIEKFYKGVTKKDFDTRDWLRQTIYDATGSVWLSRLVDRGAIAAAGADMSQRIGMGQLMPQAREATGISWLDAAIAFGGVPFDMLVGRPTRAAQQFGRGDLGGGITQFMPNFVENARRAYEWTDKGVLTRAQRKVLNPEDVDLSSVILKSLGFQPTQISDIYAGQEAERRSQSAISELRSQLTGDLARAMAASARNTDASKAEKLEADIAQAYQAIMDHNATAKRPEDVINVTRSSINTLLRRELGGVPAGFGREKRAARGTAAARREAYGLDRYNQ